MKIEGRKKPDKARQENRKTRQDTTRQNNHKTRKGTLLSIFIR